MDLSRVTDGIAVLVALLHVYVFALESLLWSRPRTARVFKVTEEESRASSLFAFNQGFYNLFLSAEAVTGLALGSRPLVDFAMASVLGAGAVLFFSAPRLRRLAVVQGLPPAIYLILRLATR
jgi:putative membrane protein